MTMEVTQRDEGDRAWIRDVLRARWGSGVIVSRGVKRHADELAALVARIDGKRVGLLTYEVAGDRCEIVTLDALTPRRGVGRALVDAIRTRARDAGCRELWLVTTNDNRPAVDFYEACGFAIAAVHENAVTQARAIKPEIPLRGRGGEPIRDEIEMRTAL